MKNHLFLSAILLSFLLNACTEAVGNIGGEEVKGFFTFDGNTHQINTSFVSVDKAQNSLNIILNGKGTKEGFPKLEISIENFSGNGEYLFSELVSLKSSVTEDDQVWNSAGCAGKVRITTRESGEIEGVVEGYLTTPYEDSFIPTRIRSSFVVFP